MDATEGFFEALDGRDDEPALRHLTGTVRFDLRRNGGVDSWMVTLTDGRVDVSRGHAESDCVATMTKSLFEALTRGEANAIAAALRGEVELEGQPALVLAFQRLFPGPASDTRARSEMIGAKHD